MTRPRPRRQRTVAGLLGDLPSDLSRPDAVTVLAVADLRPGSAQPRRSFADAGLASLAASIRQQGVLQPLLVRPVDGGHEIVAGERRWRAAQLAGLDEVPVVVRSLDDREARMAALLENLQREDLNLIDEVDAKLELAAAALGLPRDDARRRLIRLTKEEAGEQTAALDAVFGPMGESWSSFAKNKLRILGWPEVVLEALRGGLALTLASVVVGAPEAHHVRLIDLARQGASRSELQAEARRLSDPSPAPSAAAQVARKLGSRRFLNDLKPDERRAVDRWLARMPEVLKDR
ncbi:ParB/RepB/Spo0J family partition protein [Deinococcus aerophilus]|uniref:Chromosome 2-partitioning protein ParB n=1 Tax=Deinococcus aerophilus TaxID=522488 RepID=A0ABQ2H1X8_9DEIO|nr:ParB/RepB/Spo0J family partition protein [Deinococcus aerophilus]GGM21970.1 putative chromosome 2-partitioning protein ParB [Deinococcus aerophilus]